MIADVLQVIAEVWCGERNGLSKLSGPRRRQRPNDVALRRDGPSAVKARMPMPAQDIVRTWLDGEPLRGILSRKQIPIVAGMLRQWGITGMHSKVASMKCVVALICGYRTGVWGWVLARHAKAFLRALHGVSQAVEHRGCEEAARPA